MTLNYIMEARENYSADLISQLSSLYASGTTQMYAGLSFDRVRRKILYCANPVTMGGQIGGPVSGTLVGGSGYTDGDYPGEPLSGGSGDGLATAHLTISGGVVTAWVPDGNGSGYLVGDVLTATRFIGGGTGLHFTLTAVSAGVVNSTGHALWSGQNLIANAAHYDETIYKNHSIMEKDIDTDVVTRYNAWSSSAIVPSGGGGGQPTSGSITNGGTGYTPSETFFFVPLTGGSGYGMYADLTTNGSGVITGAVIHGGHGYHVSDVLGANNIYMNGVGSGFQYTISAVTTGSDGTWRRVVAANAVLVDRYCSLNLPRFVDPRTGDVWAHHEADGPATCEIYLLRRSDSFQQIISPLLPIPGGGVHMQPIALTANYLWLLNQQNESGPSYLVGTPRTIQAAETTADYLLPYPWYTWPYDDWESTNNPKWASRCCVDLSNNIYALSWNYSGVGGVSRTYTLKKFVEPSSATPYNAATVGGGFTDITPWSSSTGPNTGLPANGTFNQWLATNVVSKTCLIYLPTTNNLVALTKIFCVDLNQTWNSTHQANTHFDVTYINLTGGTFDYHANWLTGFLDASLNPTVLASASWALIDLLEVDTDLNVQSYDFTSTGVDYTLRWFFLALSPVTGGVWTHPAQDFDPSNRTCLIQVKFVPGSAPSIVQTIFDTGWNTAYAAFGTAIGQSNVVTVTAENSLNSTSFFTLDSGIYDAANNAWWWSGQDDHGYMFSLNSAFTPRATEGIGPVVPSPPFLRLALLSTPVIFTGSGYFIERMDNREWDAVEDVWCVDCALQTSLPTFNATLTASTSTGLGAPTGVTGLFGGQGYSAATTAIIQDPTGTGASVSLTIGSGIITGVVITGGTGYTYPELVFNDPAQTGIGASANVTLDNSASFQTDSAVFTSGMVGSVIRMGGGVATITTFLNSQAVIANITTPIAQVLPNSGGIPVPQLPGAWSIAAPTSIVYGLMHLAGFTVTGVADGAVVTPRLVATNGSVTLDNPATLITLGLPFTPQFQSLYLDGGNPTVQGGRKKVAGVTLRLDASGVTGMQGGSNQPTPSAQSPQVQSVPWENMDTFETRPDEALPPYGGTVPSLYTGDVYQPIGGGFDRPGQVAVQQTLPLPMNITAIVPQGLEGDQAEQTYEPKPQREPRGKPKGGGSRGER